MKQSVVYIGIDVAKAHLDVSLAQTVRRLPNQRSGHTTLIQWIKQSTTPVQLICEASGGYEQALLGKSKKVITSKSSLRPGSDSQSAPNKGLNPSSPAALLSIAA